MSAAPAESPYAARTPRLVLRAIRESDRAEFIRVCSEGRSHFAPWWPSRPEGQTDAEAFELELARLRQTLAAGTGCRLVAVVPAPERGAGADRLAGFFNMNNIVRGVFQNADAGWSVAADLVGRGYATEALGAFLDLAFAPPPVGVGLHRVQANIMPANARSLALAQRCGFRREGLAKAMLRIAGRWEDHIMFAKLAEEHTPTGAVLGPAALEAR